MLKRYKSALEQNNIPVYMVRRSEPEDRNAKGLRLATSFGERVCFWRMQHETKEISLTEYNDLIRNLSFLQPLDRCCKERETNVVMVEPMNGRNTLDVDRSCIAQCSEYGKRYVSKWD